jgi:hypothetical protein
MNPTQEQDGGSAKPIILGILAILAAGFLAICCGGMGLLMVEGEVPDGLHADLRAPLNCALDTPCLVTVTATNATGEDHQLRDVDLGTGYHQGFEVLDTDPSLTDFFEGAATGDLNLRFEAPLPAGTTQDVTIELLPIAAGRWSGTVDICFDNASRCIEQPISTIVD